jgi:GntR family transcriptional regulator
LTVLISLDEADPRPLYRQIVDDVRRAIVAGTLVPGEAIPSVRQLSTELRVNPTTVQQAYRELERGGLVYVRRGQGTYVSELPAAEAVRERRKVAVTVARRALRDATRHGLDAEELMEALRRVAKRRESRPSSTGGTAV